MEDLSSHYHLPLNTVAKKFGLCLTALKKICRRYNITRWPHRKVREDAKPNFCVVKSSCKLAAEQIAPQPQCGADGAISSHTVSHSALSIPYLKLGPCLIPACNRQRPQYWFTCQDPVLNCPLPTCPERWSWHAHPQICWVLSIILMPMMVMLLAWPQLKSLDKKIASLKVESQYTQGDEGTMKAAGSEIRVLEQASCLVPLCSPCARPTQMWISARWVFHQGSLPCRCFCPCPCACLLSLAVVSLSLSLPHRVLPALPPSWLLSPPHPHPPGKS